MAKKKFFKHEPLVYGMRLEATILKEDKIAKQKAKFASKGSDKNLQARYDSLRAEGRIK